MFRFYRKCIVFAVGEGLVSRATWFTNCAMTWFTHLQGQCDANFRQREGVARAVSEIRRGSVAFAPRISIDQIRFLESENPLLFIYLTHNELPVIQIDAVGLVRLLHRNFPIPERLA